ATTLLGMTIDELVAKAELVFQGQVIDSQSVEDTAGQISTYVSFSIQDVIKGDYDSDSLELKFMGGIANGRIMEVSGLRMPALGETGIYFVESLSTNLINPLLGWSQGHYLVQEDDDGILRITTTDNAPVTEIQPVSQVPLLIRRPQAMLEGQTDAAAGIVTEASVLMIDRAMEVEEFKSRLRDLDRNPLP
ncbi:MAG: hypothetical protein WD772_04440, partial [Pseudohongiellaceae bacterium]